MQKQELLAALPSDEEVARYCYNLSYASLVTLMNIFYNRYFEQSNISLKDSFRCTYIYWKGLVDMSEYDTDDDSCKYDTDDDLREYYYSLYFKTKE